MTYFDALNDKWLRRFMALAQHIAQWSKDPSTKVGAVIVNKDRSVLGTGYNGFPRGVKDDPERYADRTKKYPLIVHAEMNALLTAIDVREAALIVTMFPCERCAQAIVQRGIAMVVAPKTSPADPRWTESHQTARMIFTEAGVHLVELDLPAVGEGPLLVNCRDVSKTIDDARAAFAPLLRAVETVFPPYLTMVKVELREYGFNGRWQMRFTYDDTVFGVVWGAEQGFAGTPIDADEFTPNKPLAADAVTAWVLDQLRTIASRT